MTTFWPSKVSSIISGTMILSGNFYRGWARCSKKYLQKKKTIPFETNNIISVNVVQHNIIFSRTD